MSYAHHDHDREDEDEDGGESESSPISSESLDEVHTKTDNSPGSESVGGNDEALHWAGTNRTSPESNSRTGSYHPSGAEFSMESEAARDPNEVAAPANTNVVVPEEKAMAELRIQPIEEDTKENRGMDLLVNQPGKLLQAEVSIPCATERTGEDLAEDMEFALGEEQQVGSEGKFPIPDAVAARAVESAESGNDGVSRPQEMMEDHCRSCQGESIVPQQEKQCINVESREEEEEAAEGTRDGKSLKDIEVASPVVDKAAGISQGLKDVLAFEPKAEASTDQFERGVKEEEDEEETEVEEMHEGDSGRTYPHDVCDRANVIASKPGYGGHDEEEVKRLTEENITEGLDTTKLDATDVGSAETKKETGKRSFFDKFSPREEDKALSELITNALSNGAVSARDSIMGRFRKGPDNSTNAESGVESPRGKGIVDRVSGLVTSLLGKKEEKQHHSSDIRAGNPGGECEEELERACEAEPKPITQ